MREIIIGKKNSGKTNFIKQQILTLPQRFAVVDFHKEYFDTGATVTHVDYSETPIYEYPERLTGTLKRHRHLTTVVDGIDLILLAFNHSKNENNQQLRRDFVSVLSYTNWIFSFQNVINIPYEIIELVDKIHVLNDSDKIHIPARYFDKITQLKTYSQTH